MKENKEGDLNKIEYKILEYLKTIPVASSSTISFGIRGNYRYVLEYLKHLEKLGYIKRDEDLGQTHQHFTFWRLIKK